MRAALAFVALLPVFVATLAARTARAVTFEAASVGGVMEQPTSHYYLAVYGAAVSAATDSESVIGSLRYVQRPEFKNAGYDDQDFGTFALIGTKVTKKTAGRGLYAFVGGGQMSGYTKVDARVTATSGKAKSTYAMPGLTTLIEYAFHLGPVDLAFGHQAFVGYVDDAQLQAYVAWPFTFYHVSLGVKL